MAAAVPLFRKYRLPYLAVIGFLAVGSAHAQSARQLDSQDVSRAQPQARLTIEAPPTIATQLDIGRIAGALETANSKRPSPTDERNAAAQEKVAGWTPWLFSIGVADTVITVVGVVLLGFTLAATMRAAKAAEGTLRETRENARRELRAYISVAPAGITKPPGKNDQGHGLVRIHNVGKIPANHVSVIVHLMDSPERRVREFEISPDNEFVNRTIQPGSSITQGSEEHRSYADLSIRERYVYVYGAVYYDDGFLAGDGQSNRRHTNFCHRYTTDSIEGWNSIMMQSGIVIPDSDARYHVYCNEAD